MSVIIEFKKILKSYGLEYFNRYYSVYRATVFDNKDPDFLGRVRVTVPQVYGKASPQKWATAAGAIAGKKGGVFWIPSPGDPIYVMFEGGDPRYPIWLYGWWTTGSVPEKAKRENPTNYVIQTPKGLRIELDDEKEYIQVENAAGFNMQITKKGFFVGKGSSNLGKLMTDLFDLFSKTTTATKLGPQQFINIADYVKLSEEFKKLLIDAPE